MRSKFDSSLEINQHSSTVTLLLNQSGIHALVAIEKIEHLSEYALIVADFLPAGVSGQVNTLDFQAVIKNPSDEGRVRIREFADVNIIKMNKTELCQHLAFSDGEMLTWGRSNNEVDTLMEHIRQNEANPPRFELAGNRRPFATGFNCITWAENILATIDIHLKLSVSTKTIDKTIAVPEYHLKGNTYENSSQSIYSTCSLS